MASYDEGKILFLSSRKTESFVFHRMLSKMLEVSDYYPHDPSCRKGEYLDRPFSRNGCPKLYRSILNCGVGEAIYRNCYSKLACIFRHCYMDAFEVGEPPFYKLLNNEILDYFGRDFGTIVFYKKGLESGTVKEERSRCLKYIEDRDYPHFLINQKEMEESERIFDLFEFLGFPRKFENGQKKIYLEYVNEVI